MSKDTPVAVAKTTRTRKPAVSAEKMMEGIREQLVEDIRTEELGSLTLAINEQRDVISSQAETISEMRDLLASLKAMGIQGGMTAAEEPVAADGSDTVEQSGYQVEASFMDFIEIHAAVSRSNIERRPIVDQVRANYTDQSEPKLMIMRSGQFGTDMRMRNTILIMRIHEEAPFVEGEYMDNGQVVPMSDGQVDRVVGELLKAVRAAGDK